MEGAEQCKSSKLRGPTVPRQERGESAPVPRGELPFRLVHLAFLTSGRFRVEKESTLRGAPSRRLNMKPSTTRSPYLRQDQLQGQHRLLPRPGRICLHWLRFRAPLLRRPLLQPRCARRGLPPRPDTGRWGWRPRDTVSEAAVTLLSSSSALRSDRDNSR